MMNNSTTYSSDDQQWTSINIYLVVISFVIAAWSVGANTVILVCFYRNRRKVWTNFSRLTFSMTISDLLVASVWLIHLIGNQIGGQLNGFVCTISFYLFGSTQCVSLFHALGICISRKRVLQKPSAQGLTPQRNRWTIYVILASWTVPMVIILAPVIACGRFTANQINCRVEEVFGDNLGRLAMFMSTFYFTSQCITDIVYASTIVQLWLHKKKSVGPAEPTVSLNVTAQQVSIVNPPNSQSNSTLQSMIKYQQGVMVTIGMLLVLFNVLTLPKTVVYFLIGTSNSTNPYFIGISNALFVINSGINPIVYAFRIQSIKESVQEIARGFLWTLRIRR